MANDPSIPGSSSTDELESEESSASISPSPEGAEEDPSSGSDPTQASEGDEKEEDSQAADSQAVGPPAPRSEILARLAQTRAPAYSPDSDYQKQLAAFGVGSPTAKEASPRPTPLFSPQVTQHIGRFLEAASGNPAALWGEVREKADAIAGGTLGAAQGILNSGIDLANFAERHLVGQGADSQALIPDEYRFNFADRLFPHSADPTDELVRGVTQYMVPMAALSKASTAIGAVRTAGPLAQFAVHEGISALTNFAAFDPGGERLSDLVQKNPSLANPVTAYLASDPNDSKAEGRFKQTLEGMGLGVLSYPLFNATKLVRYFKGLGEAGEGAVGGAESAANSAAQDAAHTPPGENPDAPGTLSTEAPSEGLPLANAKDIQQVEGAPAAEGEVNYARQAAQETAPQGEPGAGKAMATPPGSIPARPEVTVEPRDLFKSAETETDRVFNVNLDKLGATGDTKDFIQALSEHPLIQARVAYNRQMGGDSMKGLADMLDVSVDSLMNRKIGEAWGKDQLDLARAGLQVSADDALQKSEKAFGPGASDIDKASFQTSLNRFIQLQENLTGAITETSRGLNSLRNSIPMPTGVDQAALLKEILAMGGGREGIEQTAQRIASLKQDPDAVLKLAQIAKRSWGQKVLDAASEVRINGMLSGPKTDAKYLLSHGTTLVSAPIDRAMAQVFSQIRGEPMTGVAPGEAMAMIRGGFNSFGDAVRVAGETLRTGVSPDWVNPFEQRGPAISGENFGVGGALGSAIDAIGTGIRLPTRILSSVSDFFKVMHYRMELNALAVRDSFRQGLSGQAFEDNIERILNDPPQDLHMGAVDQARSQTFQSDLTGGFEAAANLTKRVPGLNVLFPFMRTPLNIVKYGMEHTPVGLFSPQIREELAAGGLRGDLAQSKMATGTAFLGLMGGLAAQGHLTGGGPSNPAQRKVLEATGWQPYSVKIGDTYLSYKGLGPFANIMGMAGDGAELISQSENPMDLVAHGAATLAQAVTPEFMLDHVSSLIDTLKSRDPEKAKTFLSQLGASYLPMSGLSRQIAHSSDPTVRDTQNDGSQKFALWDRFLNQLKSGIPGYSSTLPPRMNMWGETIHYHPGWGSDWVSPIATSQEDHSPIVQEMERLQMAGSVSNYELPQQQRAVGLSMPTRVPTYQGVRMPLDEKEYGRLIELSAGIGLKGAPGGLSLKDNLNQMVERGYPQLGSYAGNDQFRSSEIKRTIQQYRNQAVQQLFQEDDHLYSKLRSRQQLMIQQQRSGSSQQ